MARRTAQAGITLVELMIAMAILSVAIAAAFSIGFSMINGYRESRKIVQVERAARGALSFLSSAVRSASPGVETGNIIDATGGCNPAGGISVANDDDDPDESDELTLVFASGRVVTSMHQVAAFDQGSTSLIVVDGSALQAGDKVLVIEPGVRGHLVEILSAPADNGDGTWTLNLTQAGSACGLAFSYAGATNPIVLRVKLARIYVDATGGVPMLMMDPDGQGGEIAEPIAEGIEDLQIAVAADTLPATPDGLISEVGLAANDDEWAYNVAGDLAPPVITVTPWRALRITLTARSLAPTSGATDSLRPAAEDRDEATTGDAFRRRSLSTTVEIRNLRGSP